MVRPVVVPAMLAALSKVTLKSSWNGEIGAGGAVPPVKLVAVMSIVCETNAALAAEPIIRPTARLRSFVVFIWGSLPIADFLTHKHEPDHIDDGLQNQRLRVCVNCLPAATVKNLDSAVATGHRNFNRRQQGARQAWGPARGALMCLGLVLELSRRADVEGPLPFTKCPFRRRRQVNPDFRSVAQTGAQRHPGCGLLAQPALMCLQRQAQLQTVKSCFTSRARPLGSGCGFSRRWLSIFATTDRSTMPAMILNSPPPQFGLYGVSM